MNAQEAIEKKQSYVNRLKSDISKLEKEIENPYINSKHFLFLCRRNHADLQRELEMESIVLESAKLFHQHIIPKFQEDYKKLGMNTEAESVFGVPLDKVGITKGDNR